MLGPLVNNSQLSAHVYSEFYKQTDAYSGLRGFYKTGAEVMQDNLARYGRRPMGFCGIENTQNRFWDVLAKLFVK